MCLKSTLNIILGENGLLMICLHRDTLLGVVHLGPQKKVDLDPPSPVLALVITKRCALQPSANPAFRPDRNSTQRRSFIVRAAPSPSPHQSHHHHQLHLPFFCLPLFLSFNHHPPTFSSILGHPNPSSLFPPNLNSEEEEVSRDVRTPHPNPPPLSRSPHPLQKPRHDARPACSPTAHLSLSTLASRA